MVYFTMKLSGADLEPKEIQLHIGDEFNFNPLRVDEVQADGDELEYIRNEFSNLRMSRGRVVTWFGDDARFIAQNWHWRKKYEDGQ
jgi:hypothetical protein